MNEKQEFFTIGCPGCDCGGFLMRSDSGHPEIQFIPVFPTQVLAELFISDNDIKGEDGEYSKALHIEVVVTNNK